MTTPLIVIALLLIPLAVSVGLSRYKPGIDWKAGGVIGLVLAFLFFGVGHFAQTEPMSQMLPPWVPLRIPVVYATGVLEWILAVGLVVPRFRVRAGWACIAVLIAFFPANVYAAVNAVGMGGHQWGPVYLLIRSPLQLLLIVWAWYFAARRDNP